MLLKSLNLCAMHTAFPGSLVTFRISVGNFCISMGSGFLANTQVSVTKKGKGSGSRIKTSGMGIRKEAGVLDPVCYSLGRSLWSKGKWLHFLNFSLLTMCNCEFGQHDPSLTAIKFWYSQCFLRRFVPIIKIITFVVETNKNVQLTPGQHGGLGHQSRAVKNPHITFDSPKT